MLFIVLSGIVGAGATFFALWPYGAFSAFLAAPFSRASRPCGWVGGLPATGHDILP
jgi:hypothetical protein